MSNKSTVFTYEQKGAIAILTLSRPDSYNGFNHDMTLAFIVGLEKARDDQSIRAIVINGEGRGFSAGADLFEFGKNTPEEVSHYIVQYYGEIVELIMSIPKPIISAIHGSVAGVATAFALASDLRVMSQDANIRYAFINIGLGPDGGAGWLLARQVGYSKAFEIAVEGEKISAAESLRLGLCNKIAPSGQHLEVAIDWANKLAERPTFAVGKTKLSLHLAMTQDLKSNIQLEATNQAQLLTSEDHKEGVVAFMQKRKPNFAGK